MPPESESSSSPRVLLEFEPAGTRERAVPGRIARLTLNRADVLNSFTNDFLEEIQTAFQEVREETDIRALILSGRGRAFSVGADLKERADMDGDYWKEQVLLLDRLVNSLEEVYFPVVCAVNGYALGSGLSLALASDIRICSQNALFGYPETSLGLVPAGGGMTRLARIIGEPWARELIFTARKIRPEEALRLGLVHYVYRDDDLHAESARIARDIARNGPQALQIAREAMRLSRSSHYARGLQTDQGAMLATLETGEHREALNAFQEKRDTYFTGE